MSVISIYSVASGRILRVLTTSLMGDNFAMFADANLDPGEAWAEGEFDRETTRFRAGVPETIPPAPGPWAEFNLAAWVWIDPRGTSWFAHELADAKAAALAKAAAWVATASVPLTDGVSLQEMLSWSSKQAAALAFGEGTATSDQVAMLHSEAAMTGETIPDLCARILARATSYSAAVGMFAGLRRKVEADLAATTDALACDVIVDAAIAQAAALLGGAP